ncbi:MAG: class I SAM-dependent methyltransferase [Phycisphaerae bacterium]
MLQTAEIRPDQAKAEYTRLLDEERQEYLDSRGLLRPAFAVPTDCPVCSHKERRPYDPDVQPAYQECRRCGCVYVDPRLSAEAIHQLVRNSRALNFFHEHILLATEPVRREHIFRPRLERLRRHVPAGRVLELGCAVGTFLGLLKEAGYEAQGVELCRFSIEHNRRLGRIVHERPIEQLALPPETFDAVCAWEVLCHVSSPRDTLAAAFRALRPGGVLMLTTTNVLSFEYLTLRARHHTMIPHVFYQHFTPQGIRLLLESAGTGDIAVETPGQTDVQSVRDVLGGPDPSLGRFLNHLLFDDSAEAESRRTAFQKFIAAHDRSGHMLVTARKPL